MRGTNSFMEKVNIEQYDFSAVIENSKKKLVLIIYDIVDNKRRGRLVKLLESYGNRVQKSAFETLLTTRQYDEVISRVAQIMDSEDNVRLYRLNSSNEIVLLGKSDTIYEEEVIIV